MKYQVQQGFCLLKRTQVLAAHSEVDSRTVVCWRQSVTTEQERERDTVFPGEKKKLVLGTTLSWLLYRLVQAAWVNNGEKVIVLRNKGRV